MTIPPVSSVNPLHKPIPLSPLPPPKPAAQKAPAAGTEQKPPTPPPVRPEGVGGHLDLLA